MEKKEKDKSIINVKLIVNIIYATALLTFIVGLVSLIWNYYEAADLSKVTILEIPKDLLKDFRELMTSAILFASMAAVAMLISLFCRKIIDKTKMSKYNKGLINFVVEIFMAIIVIVCVVKMSMQLSEYKNALALDFSGYYDYAQYSFASSVQASIMSLIVAACIVALVHLFNSIKCFVAELDEHDQPEEGEEIKTAECECGPDCNCIEAKGICECGANKENETSPQKPTTKKVPSAKKTSAVKQETIVNKKPTAKTPIKTKPPVIAKKD